MKNYPAYHEMAATVMPNLLPAHSATPGLTIRKDASGEESLQIALDALFYHPNVGPFIGRRLIQRLVTSNPSAPYVKRVADVFADNGQGVRGDMKAVIYAVLMDKDARTAPAPSDIYAGKLREPVIRLANWMRAFHGTSSSGRFLVGNTDSTTGALAQSPMRSPSVFNFYRPDYQPPNSAIFAAGLYAPEMQITEETSVVGYLNYMQTAIRSGAGNTRDVKADYAAELALADTPELLLDRVNLLLMQNQMSSELRTKIIGAINSNPNNSKLNKVCLAIFLTMASPEYIVQK
jgi:uncharacterized protein (DUF1800 family)